jgi:signal peptidase I
MAAEKSQKTDERPQGGFTETVKALVIAVLLALGIRSFVIEPFKIPSGSMIPTLLVGDYLVVNKFCYGVRMPITGQLLIPVGEPERGDVIVFRFPDDPSQDYIKRIVGLPGDRIEIIEGNLWISGQIVDRIAEGDFTYTDYERDSAKKAVRYREINPEGLEYTIIHQRAPRPTRNTGPWIVPEGEYFMMGDNRDNSRDSREWSDKFVSAEQIKGRAFMIHWSWVVAAGPRQNRGFLYDFLDTLYRVVTFQVEKIRWERIGRDLRGVAN